jgi:hypothetical protein
MCAHNSVKTFYCSSAPTKYSLIIARGAHQTNSCIADSGDDADTDTVNVGLAPSNTSTHGTRKIYKVSRPSARLESRRA